MKALLAICAVWTALWYPTPAYPWYHALWGASATTPTYCAEDDPCWDCTTMGNKVCGP